MLAEKQVDFFAYRSGIADRLIAERDVVLTYALQLLATSKMLDQLAFKGGTCIRKVYLGATGRFSMDLDFTARTPVEPDDAVLELMGIFNQEMHGVKFSLDKDWRITQGGLSFTVQPRYSHAWNPDGAFDLQVSMREQPTLDLVVCEQMPQAYFKYLEFPPPRLPCLELHEVIAEKIRAAFQRGKVRDIHDLFMFATSKMDHDLLRRLVVLKLWQVRDVFDPELLADRLQKGEYDWDDLRQLLRKSERIDPADIIKKCLDCYGFLTGLTEEERRLVVDGKRHAEQALWGGLSQSCKRKLATGSFGN